MDAKHQEMLSKVPDFADLRAAASAHDGFFQGVLIEGGFIGKTQKEILLALEDGTILAVPFNGVINLTNLTDPNPSVPGQAVSVRLAFGTKVVTTKTLEVGKDIVAPLPSQETRGCPSQCTQPVQCGTGCCCGGKKCQGKSCVD